MNAEAKIRITAQDDSAAAFKKATANIEALKASSAGISRIGGVVAGGLAVVGLSVAGLLDKFKTVLDGVDRLNDLKDATGASIENLSALEDVAARTGTSMDTVSTAVIKFNKVLLEAKPGSEMSKTLEAIGLNAQKLQALDPAEGLLKVAVALQGFANDGNKARFVQELFGKSIKEVAPLLKDLAEKGELVATVTTDQAERAERLTHALNSLGKSSQDAGRAILDGLAPSMAKLVENYNAMKSLGLLGTVLKDAAKSMVGLGDLSSNPGGDINALLERRTALQTEYNKALEQGGLFNRKLFGKELGADIKAQIDQVNELLAVSRIRQVGDININSGDSADALSRRLDRDKPTLKFDGAKTGSAKPKADQITDAQRALAQYVESLSKVLEKEQDLTAVEKALNFLRTQGVQGQIPKVRELVLGLAAQVDLEKELADRLKLKRNLTLEAGDAVNKSNEEYQALLSRLLEATPTTKLAQQRADVKLLTAEFEAGRVSELLYLEAVSARLDLVGNGLQDLSRLLDAAPSAKLAEQRADVQLLTAAFEAGRISESLYLEAVSARLDLVGDGLQDLSTFAARAAQNIQDALGDTLANALQGNFKDIGSNFTKMINRMVAEAASAQIMESLFGKFTKGSGSAGGGGGGGLLGKVFGGGGSVAAGPGGESVATSGVFEDFFKSIFRFADGGFVTGPGTGTSDSIAAWLSNGEHVTNARQTAKWLPLLSAINSGEIDRAPKFATGGLVSKFSNGATQPMFSPSGQVRANDSTDSERSGESITVNQNFTVGDVATASMVRQAVAGSERRIAAGIGRSQRYGGALA